MPICSASHICQHSHLLPSPNCPLGTSVLLSYLPPSPICHPGPSDPRHICHQDTSTPDPSFSRPLCHLAHVPHKNIHPPCSSTPQTQLPAWPICPQSHRFLKQQYKVSLNLCNCGPVEHLVAPRYWSWAASFNVSNCRLAEYHKSCAIAFLWNIVQALQLRSCEV